MDHWKAQRIHAMHEVLAWRDGKPSHQFWLRHVFRWYSKTFNTPLHEVEDLPIDEVMRHYYEDHYVQLASDADGPEGHHALQRELRELADLPEPDAEKAAGDDEFLKAVLAEEERLEAKRAPAGSVPATPPAPKGEAPQDEIRMDFADLAALERDPGAADALPPLTGLD